MKEPIHTLEEWKKFFYHGYGWYCRPIEILKDWGLAEIIWEAKLKRQLEIYHNQRETNGVLLKEIEGLEDKLRRKETFRGCSTGGW